MMSSQINDFSFDCGFSDEEPLGLSCCESQSSENSCYKMNYNVCLRNYPFSENWENINPITIRLNFHFMQTGTQALNFGEEDGNCPTCPNNSEMTIYKIAQDWVNWLNSSSQNMSDYLRYKEDTTHLNPPIPFTDTEGHPVPNLGDSKLRFVLYEENGQGSVFRHEMEEYKFQNHPEAMTGDCSDGQSRAPLDEWKIEYSVYGNKVIDIFLYDEWAPFHGYVDTSGNFITCRRTRGIAFGPNVIGMTNLWYGWEYHNKGQNEPVSGTGHWHYMSLLWHELGHALSLQHNWPTSNFSCCDANDHQIYLGNNRNGWYLSNNTMGYNPHFVTFSPCQIDQMFNYVYQHDFNHIVKDPGFSYLPSPYPELVIDGGTVNWNTSKEVDKHIRIKSGSRLNLNDMSLKLGAEVNIFVERGAMLYLSPGSEILSLCTSIWERNRWGAIWVAGNPERDHPESWYEPFSSDGQDPGRVVIEGGTIKGAKAGIITTYFSVNLSQWPWSINFSPGGYVYADQADFIDCNMAAYFPPFKRENKSKFLGCHFGRSFSSPIVRTVVGVFIEDNYGVEFEYCIFDRMDQHGILIKDGGAIIHNENTFKGSQNGTAISILNAGTFIPSTHIVQIGSDPNSISAGNNFEGNLLDIRVEGGNSFIPVSIRENTFQGNWNPGSPSLNQKKNIEVLHARVFIEENNFYQTYQNVSFKGLQASFNSRFRNNKFLDFHTGIWFEPNPNITVRYNSIIACNIFLGNNSSGVFLDESTIFRQGNEFTSNANQWERGASYTPTPGIYDIRITEMDDGGPFPFASSGLFDYHVKHDLPLIHTMRPLCNLTHSVQGCGAEQKYAVKGAQDIDDCNQSSSFFDQESYTIEQLRLMINQIVLSDSLYWVNNEYVYLSGRKYTAVGRVVDSLVVLDLYNRADSVLALEPEFEYTMLRYGIRLRSGNYNSARSFLNSIQTEDELSTDFVTVQNIHLDFLTDTALVIDSAIITDLEVIADKRSMAGSHAKTLLSLFDLRNWKPTFAIVTDSIGGYRMINVELLTNQENKRSLIYPNPGSGQFTLIVSESKFDAQELIFLSIYSSTGQTLFQEELKANDQNEIHLDLNTYPTGLYIIDISQKGNVSEQLRVVKQ